MSGKAYHTQNCGVLFVNEGKKILVDGLWNDENLFSVMSDDMKKRFTTGKHLLMGSIIFYSLIVMTIIIVQNLQMNL